MCLSRGRHKGRALCLPARLCGVAAGNCYHGYFGKVCSLFFVRADCFRPRPRVRPSLRGHGEMLKLLRLHLKLYVLFARATSEIPKRYSCLVPRADSEGSILYLRSRRVLPRSARFDIDSRWHIPDLVAGPNRPIIKQSAQFWTSANVFANVRKLVIRGGRQLYSE